MHSLSICLTVLAALIFGANALVRRQDLVSTTPAAPPVTNVADATNGTDDNMNDNSTDTMMTTMASPDDDMNMTTTAPPVTTTAPTTPTTPTPNTPTTPTTTSTTTTPVPVCNKDIEKINAVSAFTSTPDFRALPDNEQIFVYEMLAAGEGCIMTQFITAETAERIFRLLGDLPLRWVFSFTGFISSTLQNEGVIIPY